MANQNAQISDAYRAYAPAIQAFIISKTGCYHTAEDLLQEAFIRLQGVADVDEIKDIKSYLFRIANNLIIDQYRSKNCKSAPVQITDIEEETNPVFDTPSAEDVNINQEKISQVVSVLGELSTTCQNIFWLSRAYGFRNREIASMQNTCLSTVEKNISRASKYCANRFVENYG